MDNSKFLKKIQQFHEIIFFLIILPKIQLFLLHSHYLEVVEDPLDLRKLNLKISLLVLHELYISNTHNQNDLSKEKILIQAYQYCFFL